MARRSMIALVVGLGMVAGACGATTPEGLLWLKAKASQRGVKSHPRGFHYKVLKAGKADGKSPGPSDLTRCHYEGRLIDGTVFDSSEKRERPGLFAPKQVIEGWKIAMQMMKEGDKWELYLPSELAYGDRSKGKHIKPGSVLIFKLEILEVAPPQNYVDILKDNYVAIIIAVLTLLVFCLPFAGRGKGSGGANAKRVPIEAAMSDDDPRVFIDLTVGRAGPLRITFRLFKKMAPKAVENFRQLCTGETDGFHYKGSKMHRVIPGFMAQGGDFTSGNGTGGKSVYGTTFDDEWGQGLVSHADRGLLSMANRGANTNGSQFFITFKATKFLDGKHVVFGIVESGLEHLKTVEEVGTSKGAPGARITVEDCGQLSSKK